MSDKAYDRLLAKLTPADQKRILHVAQEYDIDRTDPAWVGLAAIELGLSALDRAVQELKHLEQVPKRVNRSLPNGKDVESLQKQFADLLAVAEQIRDQTTAVIKKRDSSLGENLKGLREVHEGIHRLLTDNGAARWRRCADHAVEQVEAINETTSELKKRIEESGDGFQKRVDVACKQITKARGQAVGRLQALHYQFILWLTGSVFASAILAAVLTSWVATGRPPWTAYTDNARRLSHGVILERAWPKLSVQERQRIEQAAQR
jgi:hypothetical protein